MSALLREAGIMFLLSVCVPSDKPKLALGAKAVRSGMGTKYKSAGGPPP